MFDNLGNKESTRGDLRRTGGGGGGGGGPGRRG